ncbi:MAG: DUF2723 domain-containing protein [Candidatus Edwardsbacteria bacterium]
MQAETKIRWLIALLVFLAVFIVYTRTMAPTTPFWDCGEMVTVSYILGIPHPPGYPLYTCLGRVISLLPLAKAIVVRVTLLTITTNALAMAGLYLIFVKITSGWLGKPKTFLESLALHLSGVSASLLYAFCCTQWFKGVEPDVFPTAIPNIVFVLLLALLWKEHRKENLGSRILVLICFWFALTTGMHLLGLLVAPAIFIFLLLTDWRPRNFVYIVGFFFLFVLAEGGGLSLIPLGVVTAFLVFVLLLLGKDHLPTIFFLLIFSLFLFATGRPELTPVVLLEIILFFLLSNQATPLVNKQRSILLDWRVVASCLLLLGLTIHFFLVVRAHQRPAINETNPSSTASFLECLERKQYEPFESFKFPPTRRADLGYQFGFMYARYFFWQWAPPGISDAGWREITQHLNFTPIIEGFTPLRFFSFIVFPLLGIWGIIQHFRNDKKTFGLLVTLFLFANVGLAFYLNMNDPQVRDRDYAFMPSFAVFSFWIGMGMLQVWRWLSERLPERIGILRKVLCLVTILVLFAFSFIPLFSYYHLRDRSGNWIPEDYAYNILESCEPNAILFTNGDNDTFPLWFAQQVKNVRKDVKIANLSLLNTPWYLEELKVTGVPLNLSLQQIREIGPVRRSNGKIMMVNEIGVRDIIAANVGKGKNEAGQLDPRLLLAADTTWVRQIFDSNYQEKYPVYFAVTVSEDNLMGVQPHLRFEGLVYKVVPEQLNKAVDVERSRYNLYEVYRYRGIFDPAVYKDDNTAKLLGNYAVAHWQIGLALRRSGRIAEAVQEFERAAQLAPDEPANFHWLGMTYAEKGRALKIEGESLKIKGQTKQAEMKFALAESTFTKAIGNFKKLAELYPQDPRLFAQLGTVYAEAGRIKEAISVLQHSIEINPNFGEGYGALFWIYAEQNDSAKAIGVLESWLKRFPNDNNARTLLEKYQKGEKLRE